MAAIINADDGVISGASGLKLSSDTSGALNIQTNGVTAIAISASQAVSFPATTSLNFASANITNLTATTLTVSASTYLATASGNVGIGTSSPGYKLDVQNPVATTFLRLGVASINSGAGVIFNGASTKKNWVIASQYNVNGGLEFTQTTAGGGSSIGSTPAMALDENGNLGLGVTPSAWDSSYKAVRVNNFTLASQDQTGGGELSKNSYVASGGANTYIANGFATKYEQTAGTHKWFTAASGTAGNAITFTAAMTLDASGNLGINSTSPGSFGKVVVQVAGTTSPTNLTNVGPSSINLYAASNGSSTSCTTGIFGWNADTGIGSGIGFSRESSSDWGTQIRFYTHPTSTTNIGDITERARILSDGKFCIGDTSSNYLLRVGGAINNNAKIGGFNIGQSASEYPSAGFGVRFTTSINTYNYDASDYAVMIRYGQNNGRIETFTAAEGTAGNQITFTTGPYVANLGTSWTNSSDERLKNITGEIQNGLAKVCSLRAAEFTWKTGGTGKQQVGLIAQDVLNVLPEVVVIPDAEFDGTAGTAMGVNYDQTIPLLVAAIKELKSELDQLKGKL